MQISSIKFDELDGNSISDITTDFISREMFKELSHQLSGEFDYFQNIQFLECNSYSESEMIDESDFGSGSEIE